MRIPWGVQQWVMRVAVRWFYRRVEDEGLERIPASGPVILAANHNNALVDALVIGALVRRRVRLTAKATLLDHPITRFIVHAVGIVPLRRAKDEAKRSGTVEAGRNEGAFDAIIDTLRNDGMILIFPEGISHSEPELAPLRTGCARMALQALDAGVPQVTIVPVGLTFEAKGRPRSRVLLTVGTPISATSVHDATDRVRELTARVDDGLRDVTLNFPTTAAARQVLEVSRTLSRLFGTTPPLDTADIPLGETVRVARQVEGLRRVLPDASPDDAAQVDRFLERLEAWRRRAVALGVSPAEVDMETSIGRGAGFVVREGLAFVVSAPVALWGRVNHLIPLRLALWIGKATSRNPDEPAMHTLVGGFALVLVVYLALAGVVAWRVGWGWALLYLVSLPATASFDFWLRDRWRAFVRRARGYLALRRHPAEAHTLLDERESLRAEARRLDTMLTEGRPGSR
ncbi:MAG: 1-acyl-sn-glycerol-3-phosphate acyltransferase [Gemmatimonadetes bacterium]|nr:1-acyl-sn-glycerol-3-phosphate acyltransferase [Gemmatimonadota bacterium]